MFKNFIWDFAGKFGGQAISFGISIILTRLLTPQEYGIMGMSMAVIIFAHVFLDLGFNRAIIQQAEVSEIQLSTIFYINACIAGVLTLLCFFIASPLAQFYNQPLIKPVFRILSITFILNGLNLVPSALIYKRMQLKANSILNLIAAFISGVIGVIMAYSRYGIWSLVTQSIINTALILVLTFIYAKWVPIIKFSIHSITPLWEYGSRMFASGVVDIFFTRLDTFVIGKVFSASILGYYSRAQSMDNLVRQFTANTVMGVLFPFIAKYQYDKEYLKKIYLQYLHIIVFASIGISGVLFLIAKHLFIILFTQRWLYSAELFQLISITSYSWPVSSLMCNIIAGVGNSKAFFRLEMLKKAILIPVYIFGFLMGIKGFIYFLIVAAFLAVILNAYYVYLEIDVKMILQIKILLKYYIIGIISCTAYYIPILLKITNHFLIIAVLTVSFMLIYILLTYMYKLEGVKVVKISYEKLKSSFA